MRIGSRTYPAAILSMCAIGRPGRFAPGLSAKRVASNILASLCCAKNVWKRNDSHLARLYAAVGDDGGNCRPLGLRVSRKKMPSTMKIVTIPASPRMRKIATVYFPAAGL